MRQWTTGIEALFTDAELRTMDHHTLQAFEGVILAQWSVFVAQPKKLNWADVQTMAKKRWETSYKQTYGEQ